MHHASHTTHADTIFVEVNQANISLVVYTKIEVGTMNDGGGGSNQKPLIGARATALSKMKSTWPTQLR